MPPSLRGQFRVAGVLGTGAVAGLTGSHIFGDIKGAAGRIVVTAAERALFKDALKKVGRRMAGHLLRESSAWQKAFTHIAQEHFGQVLRKATNGVFLKKFHTQEAMESLLRQVVTRPGRKAVLSASHPLNTSGRPVIMVERTFGDIVGHLTKDGVLKECRIVRVFLDLTGRPTTAFPAIDLLKL